MLDNLISRGLRTPELVIVDGGSGLDKALAALWPDAPVQRCTVHKHRNLLAHAPDRLHEEVSADYNDMIYAATRQEIEAKRKASPRENGGSNVAPSPTAWRKREIDCSLSRASRKANGNRSEPRTPSNACTRNSSDGSRRRPSCRALKTAAMLFWALLASGQITMRKVDGWPTLAQKPSDQIIDLAA